MEIARPFNNCLTSIILKNRQTNSNRLGMFKDIKDDVRTNNAVHSNVAMDRVI